MTSEKYSKLSHVYYISPRLRKFHWEEPDLIEERRRKNYKLWKRQETRNDIRMYFLPTGENFTHAMVDFTPVMVEIWHKT